MNCRSIARCSLGLLVLFLAACPSTEDEVTFTDETPRVVEPDGVELVADAGKTTTETGRIENTGTADLTVDLKSPAEHAGWLESVEPTSLEVEP